MASDIGIVGLGVMGRNLALNAADKGYVVSAYNRHVPGVEEDIARDFAEEHDAFEINGFDDLAAFVNSLQAPRKVLLMVKAGDATDAVISELIPLLQSGDVLIDGGNAHFVDTMRRLQRLEEAGIHFVGMGVSGGAEGARNGPSLMPGGSRTGYDLMRSLLDAIAAKDVAGNPCCDFIGPGGAGHFVKMVHNGIEYAEMQLLTECVGLLSAQHAYDTIADVMTGWQETGTDSYLLEITIRILRHRENGRPVLDQIVDRASHKGTGVWTVLEGFNLGVPIPTITAAVEARQLSNTRTSQLITVHRESPDIDPGKLRDAYHTARVINHVIGFELLRQASFAHHFELNLSEVARCWTAGCIIRSELMQWFVPVLQSQDQHVLTLPGVQATLEPGVRALRSIVAQSAHIGVFAPVMSAALNYLAGMRNPKIYASLIQAQRDYFGQHGFERTDGEKGVLYHGKW